ncbi:hypothetical protein B0H14DRAFT_3856635 [Mycena olivaceomarginata]|nr:hypothetical protein B0H14DRAFT_3856635 [Mycena olivaceomarginata]
MLTVMPPVASLTTYLAADLSDAVVLSAPVATTTELVATVLPANARAATLAPASDLFTTPPATSSPTVEQPGLGPVTAHAPSPAALVLISRASGAEPPALPSIVSGPSTPVRAAGPLGMESPIFGPPAAQHQPVLDSSVAVPLDMPAAVVVPPFGFNKYLGPGCASRRKYGCFGASEARAEARC